jgi:uncharacterized protein (TIGR02271 family)
MTEGREDRDMDLAERYSGYEVYDRDGDKIGKVDELFVDENDTLEYLGVKMGLLGLGGSALVPWESARVNEGDRRIEVLADKETIKNGPSYEDDQEITPEYEERVHGHYGLSGGRQEGTTQRGAYGDYYERDEEFTSSAAAAGVAGGERGEAEARGAEAWRDAPLAGEHDREGMTDEERPSGGRGHAREYDRDRGFGHERDRDYEREGSGATARGAGEDELRVQRSEEELRAGTREREAGAMRVRKRVRTDREQVRVPTRREEVSVERVPVDQEGTGAEIGEDEVSVPVVEEEVVVDKRPVVKEEIRVRKDVVEDEEVVEEDVRKEEVEVDDQTTTRGRGRETDLDDQTGRGR